MKDGKILIVMIFAAFSFTANAKTATYPSNGINSVEEFAYALDLTESQVYDWEELNSYYEDEFYAVRSNNSLSRHAKSRKLDKLYYQRDRGVRKILSRNQYRTFSGLKSYNVYLNPGTNYNRNSTRYSNSYNRSRSYYGTSSRFRNSKFRGNRFGRSYSCGRY